MVQLPKGLINLVFIEVNKTHGFCMGRGRGRDAQSLLKSQQLNMATGVRGNCKRDYPREFPKEGNIFHSAISLSGNYSFSKWKHFLEIQNNCFSSSFCLQKREVFQLCPFSSFLHKMSTKPCVLGWEVIFWGKKRSVRLCWTTAAAAEGKGKKEKFCSSSPASDGHKAICNDLIRAQGLLPEKQRENQFIHLFKSH